MYPKPVLHVLMLILVLVSCGQNPHPTSSEPLEETFSSGVSSVRVFNAVPETSVDVFIDENKAFGNVPFMARTSYRELPQRSTIRFLVRQSGPPGRPLAQKTETISQGDRYTIFVFPATRWDEPEVKVLSDNTNPAPIGCIGVRFINACPTIGEADLCSTSRRSLLFENIAFATEGGYSNFEIPGKP
jgi:hypothetical protein